MNRNNVVSVCIASYNGELYIAEQVRSILCQLATTDEIVIVDDCSTDKTIYVVNELDDDRIKIFGNETNVGVVSTFERAISLATGDFIFLCDQDDVWPDNRVRLALDAFASVQRSVISGRHKEFFGDKKYVPYNKYKPSSVLNSNRYVALLMMLLGSSPYFGCCICFKRSALKFLLPFPDGNFGHDHWIAISSLSRGELYHIEEVLVLRRLHQTNLTNRNRKFIEKIKTRFAWFCLVVSEHLKLLLRAEKK